MAKVTAGNKMKCALIIPSWVPEDIFSSKTAGSQINYWQPLGTLYVASSLMKAGHEVRFLNGAFMTHSEILKELHDFQPDVAGIYSTAFGWKKAVHAASQIKMLLKDIFITVGGPYPIAMQEKCLEDLRNIDAVITGEGELTMVEMLQRLSEGKNLEGVLGVIYREGDKIVKNPPRPLITDLDSLPFPARELLGDDKDYIPPPATYKRKPVAVIITARGCNRRCLFCFQIDKTRKSGIRFRSVENVLEEIELCIKQGYREIKFIDDTLAADYDRAMKLAGEIKKRGLDFAWFASACVNQVDKPLLQAFKDAGCWAILFGAESGVQKDLNAIKKGITLEQTRKAVKAAKEVGLTVHTPFLFGIPGQTYEDGLKSIEFACELDPEIASFHAITPFPGSELYDNLEKYGTMSDDLRDFTYQGAAFVPYSMTRDEISELRQLAYKRFYSRPGYVVKRLLKFRSINDIKAAFQGVKSLFWIWAERGIFSSRKSIT
ncbi:MAG: radical SAM protein [Thermodesulfovibrionia bacterium]|nr:radical SAM protein [Thermodesulfovibrionia bacterium]